LLAGSTESPELTSTSFQDSFSPVSPSPSFHIDAHIMASSSTANNHNNNNNNNPSASSLLVTRTNGMMINGSNNNKSGNQTIISSLNSNISNSSTIGDSFRNPPTGFNSPVLASSIVPK
jgi:hypothetical protein